MPPLLDGLLDPEQDLHLLSLALRTPSHAALAHQALLRPPSLYTDIYHVPPPSPPPPHDPLASSRALAHLHLAQRTPCLLVPPLRLPWASALSAALRHHLQLSLHVVRSRAARPSALLAALSRGHRVPSAAADAFYPPLAACHREYNAVILRHLRAAFPAHVLDRIATAVKLAFVHSLLRVLQAPTRPPAGRLAALKAPTPTPPPRRSPSPTAASAPAPAPATPVLVTDAWRVPLPLPRPHPPRRRRAPRARSRPAFLVSARWARDAAHRPHALLLDGHSIPAKLVPRVAALLAQRYAVHLDLDQDAGDGDADPPHRGALVSLSNAGTALLRGAPRREGRRRAAGVPLDAGDSLTAYLHRCFGLRWPAVCVGLVKEAGAEADGGDEEAEVGEAVNDVVDVAIREAEGIRRALVKRAILHETAGQSLVRMCAFSVAQQADAGDVDRELEGFPDEYREVLREAKFTIQQIEGGCPVPLKPLAGEKMFRR